MSHLNQPVTIKALKRLNREGVIGSAELEAALELIRPPRAWWTWVSRMLLFLGAALILSGVIFFFAYNWQAMGRFLKFGLIEAALFASAAGALYLGLDRLPAKVLLLSASVLTGALLAVYGQTYQTGADAYELFAGWAALIIIWVAVSEFAGLWIL